MGCCGVARREGVTGCGVGVCCQERGIDRVLCWCMLPGEGLIGCCVGVCCQERGIERVLCWCMLPGERE